MKRLPFFSVLHGLLASLILSSLWWISTACVPRPSESGISVPVDRTCVHPPYYCTSGGSIEVASEPAVPSLASTPCPPPPPPQRAQNLPHVTALLLLSRCHSTTIVLILLSQHYITTAATALLLLQVGRTTSSARSKTRTKTRTSQRFFPDEPSTKQK